MPFAIKIMFRVYAQNNLLDRSFLSKTTQSWLVVAFMPILVAATSVPRKIKISQFYGNIIQTVSAVYIIITLIKGINSNT
jgi:hypothetical protein